MSGGRFDGDRELNINNNNIYTVHEEYEHASVSE